MKGQSELTATFIKLCQIALVIIGALAIFFTFIEYEIFVYRNDAEREAYILGNALLSSDCLGDGTKGLFTKTKLDLMRDDSSCFKYSNGRVDITLSDSTESWSFEFEEPTAEKMAEFDVLVKYDGVIKTAEMLVSL